MHVGPAAETEFFYFHPISAKFHRPFIASGSIGGDRLAVGRVVPGERSCGDGSPTVQPIQSKGENMMERLILGVAVTLLLTGASAVAQDTRTLVERGRYLVEGIAACGLCHMGRDGKGAPAPDRGLSGGLVQNRPDYTVRMSNITPDPDTGIGRWTDAQVARSIREGIRPDGSIIGPPMPIAFYRDIADDDLAAIVAYLRAQPAVQNEVPRSEYKKSLPNYGPPIQAPIVSPSSSDPVKYGEYLAGPLGHCTLCHTSRDPDGRPNVSKWGAGGVEYRGPWGLAVSRNLTPHESGLRDWTDQEIERAVREGVRRDGSRLKPPMPYNAYKRISDSDMKALIAYMRSLPPTAFGGTTEPNAKQAE